jgi:hypothetical protein
MARSLHERIRSRKTQGIIALVMMALVVGVASFALRESHGRPSPNEAAGISRVHPGLRPRTVSSSSPEPAVGLYWTFTGDPTTGAGVCAPQWQLGFRLDNDTLYYKSGTACTAWTVFSGGGGAVTGNGTANTMTVWTGTSAIGNSLMTTDGSGDLNMNPAATNNNGTIVRTLDSTGGVWSVWRSVDVIEAGSANYAQVLSTAFNTPLGSTYDHTQAVCWNYGRANASEPQICRGDIESHWGSNTEEYDTTVTNDGKEHRWIGNTIAWDGSVSEGFFAASSIAIGDWSSPAGTIAQFASSPTPTTTASSFQLGGLQSGYFGTSFAVEDNDTSNAIMEVGTTSNPSNFFEVTASGTNVGTSLTTTPLNADCSKSGSDCSITVTNSASEVGTLTQRSTGNVDITATSGNVRLFGTRQQAISFFDTTDAFGNKSVSLDGATGTAILDHIASETDVSLTCAGGGTTTCSSNACNNNGGTFTTTSSGATTCTVTFAGPPASSHAPSCTVNIQVNNAIVFVSSETGTAITIAPWQTSTTIPANTNIDYNCWFH